MPTRTCGTRLTWEAFGEGITAGNHRFEFEGRPPVEVSAASRYRGDPTLLDPEELFVPRARLASSSPISPPPIARCR